MVLPGGFRLRRFIALWRHCPLRALTQGSEGPFAAKGGTGAGIANGFQWLTELGLLPGA